MKILSVVGARPQFIKASPVSTALRAAGHREVLVHTGQHYDDEMSRVFFDELGIPAPDINLQVGSGSHGRQTAQMLMGVEAVLLEDRPDWVLVYGDTNSTLAGALAACKQGIPLAHVEAGLRSFNRTMPEEHNRVIADQCADLLFCPTATAVRNLEREGLGDRSRLVGDTMYDAVLRFARRATAEPLLDRLGVQPGGYLLATVHRAYNTDDPARLRALLAALGALGEPVVFPVHPRTRARLADLNGDEVPANVRAIDPVGYLQMIALERDARMILTDSGGVQKEAFFLRVPCATLRPETEWTETVEAGWNVVVDVDAAAIATAVERRDWPETSTPDLFGDGRAAEHIVHELGAAR